MFYVRIVFLAIMLFFVTVTDVTAQTYAKVTWTLQVTNNKTKVTQTIPVTTTGGIVSGTNKNCTQTPISYNQNGNSLFAGVVINCTLQNNIIVSTGALCDITQIYDSDQSRIIIQDSSMNIMIGISCIKT